MCIKVLRAFGYLRAVTDVMMKVLTNVSDDNIHLVVLLDVWRRGNDYNGSTSVERAGSGLARR